MTADPPRTVRDDLRASVAAHLVLHHRRGHPRDCCADVFLDWLDTLGRPYQLDRDADIDLIRYHIASSL